MKYYIYRFNAASPGVPSAVLVFSVGRDDIGMDWQMQTFFLSFFLYTNSLYQFVYVPIISR